MINQCNITYKTLLQVQGMWQARKEPIEVASQQFEFPQQ
jgi:lipopolysaccharide export system protein LptA